MGACKCCYTCPESTSSGGGDQMSPPAHASFKSRVPKHLIEICLGSLSPPDRERRGISRLSPLASRTPPTAPSGRAVTPPVVPPEEDQQINSKEDQGFSPGEKIATPEKSFSITPENLKKNARASDGSGKLSPSREGKKKAAEGNSPSPASSYTDLFRDVPRKTLEDLKERMKLPPVLPLPVRPPPDNLGIGGPSDAAFRSPPPKPKPPQPTAKKRQKEIAA